MNGKTQNGERKSRKSRVNKERREKWGSKRGWRVYGQRKKRTDKGYKIYCFGGSGEA